jgi:hypothetical protein
MPNSWTKRTSTPSSIHDLATVNVDGNSPRALALIVSMFTVAQEKQ